MPNDFLRDRLQRKLASLPDERLYQVLDFVEFLETKYAPEQPATSATGMFTRFAEGLEDKLRAGKVSTQTIAETMNLMHRAVGVLNGVAAAGRSVASDIVDGVSRATATGPAGTGGATGAGGTPGTGTGSGGTGSGGTGSGGTGSGGTAGAGAPPASAGAPSPASAPGTPTSGDRPA